VKQVPAALLDELPEWDGAHISPLPGGLTNPTWLLDKDGRRAVLKIDDSPRGAPYSTRRGEARIQALAAERGLANRVLLATDTIYLTEYVDGIVWSAGCLEDDQGLVQLAGALKKLHSLPLTGRRFDAAGAARAYAERIEYGDRRAINACLRRIDAGPRPVKLCCCHNDLVVENIISTPETRFLDWEYACDNDPLFDLATVAAHHELKPERCDDLLDAYFDGDGRRWRRQLARQADIYRALLYLWSAARQNDGTSPPN
jgi:thiamine kinase-like enzyme